jgi:hypothetical protein
MNSVTQEDREAADKFAADWAGSAFARFALASAFAAHRRTAHAQGMIEAARICGSLAETTYDDADGFVAATGCEAAIMKAVSALAPEGDAP